MATIRIPPILRPDAGGNRQVEVGGVTVREALQALVAEYPALRDRVFVGDELPAFLNVYLDKETDVRLLEGLDTGIGEQSTLLLLPAVAGGSQRPSSGRRAPDGERLHPARDASTT